MAWVGIDMLLQQAKQLPFLGDGQGLCQGAFLM